MVCSGFNCVPCGATVTQIRDQVDEHHSFIKVFADSKHSKLKNLQVQTVIAELFGFCVIWYLFVTKLNTSLSFWKTALYIW